MPDSLQHLMDIAVDVEPYSTLAKIASTNNLGFHIVKPDAFAGSHLSAGMHQGHPGLRIVADGTQEEHLYVAASRMFPRAMTEQS